MKYFNPGIVYIIIAVLSVTVGLLVFTTFRFPPTQSVTEPSVTESSVTESSVTEPSNKSAFDFILINPNSIPVQTRDKDDQIINEYTGTRSQIIVQPGGYICALKPDGTSYCWVFEDIVPQTSARDGFVYLLLPDNSGKPQLSNILIYAGTDVGRVLQSGVFTPRN